MQNTDTICALATPYGKGAIAIIRLSGTEAISIIDQIFRPANPVKNLKEQKTGTIHYGNIFMGSEIIDDVLLSIFHKPHSYTGEDSIEISCHGSLYIQQQLIQILVQNGARLAKPGEFTQRAFLNGKMDLSQAEAVADLIASSSKASHKIAINQIRGGFSKELNDLRQKLLHFISMIELELDFSEEDVEFADRKEMSRLIHVIKEKVFSLVKSFTLGNVIKNGIPVAIIGEPNVGKSTLMNALFNEEKAIVSDIAGTTRDAIEDILNIEGVLFRLIDTAGLRQTNDYIESLGIEKTIQKIKQADLIILMIESTNDIQVIESKIIRTIDDFEIENQHVIILINKIDQFPIEPLMLHQLNKIFPDYTVVSASARKKQNLDILTGKLKEIYDIHSISDSDIIVSNLRHYEALINANEALGRADQGLSTGVSTDFIAMDIRQVLHYLGEITGQISTDEILGNIFKNFCIGK